jgi:RHS repeat-associated protein
LKRANGILKDEVFWTTTFYVYDATGNVMAVYERSYLALSQFNLYNESVRLIEQHIYGSDRIGLRKCNVLVYEDVFSISAIDSNTHEFIGKAKPVLSGGDGTGNGGRGPVASPAVHVIVGSGNHLAEQYQRTLGDKRYELKNHLGNVLTVITDRKIAVDNVSYVSGNGTYMTAPSNNQLFLLTVTGTFVQVAAADLKVDYYRAEIVKSSEYSCYGVELSGWGGDEHRYGFQDQETDKELWSGAVSYLYRIEDPRLGRFFSVDPLAPEYAYNSPYAFSENRVIDKIELEGLEMAPLTLGGSSSILTLSSADAILMEGTAGRAIPNQIVEGLLETSKLGEIATKTVTTGNGKPWWNPLLSPFENFRAMREIGNKAHESISKSIEFLSNYSKQNRQLTPGNRPDGFTIDKIAKTIRIAEIKSATKTGIQKGVTQLTRYVSEAQKAYPEYEIIPELWLYNSIVPVTYFVQPGDNLYNIATAYGTTVDRLYQLNPGVDRNNSTIFVGQELIVDNLTFNYPNIQNVGDVSFDSNTAEDLGNGTFRVMDINSNGYQVVQRNSDGSYKIVN